MTTVTITAEIVRTTKVSVFVAIPGFAHPHRCIEVAAVRDLGDGRIEVGAVDHGNILAALSGLATVDAERAAIARTALTVVEEDRDDVETDDSFRAAFWVAADGQSDVCLTAEDEAGLPDAALIASAIAVAHDTGLIGDVTGLTEADVRDGIRIGAYRR